MAKVFQLTERGTNTNIYPITVKEAVGLSNVDNTSDIDKPISTAVQSALDLMLPRSEAPTKVSDLKNDAAYINMNFLGLDLSSVPQENIKDPKVYIIPILYVLTSMISMKISTNTTQKNNKDKKILEKENKEVKKEQEELDMAEQMTKNMSWFMPIMAVSISIIAPLGLALYWLVNNILMIFERLFLNKFFKDEKEEAKNNA